MRIKRTQPISLNMLLVVTLAALTLPPLAVAAAPSTSQDGVRRRVVVLETTRTDARGVPDNAAALEHDHGEHGDGAGPEDGVADASATSDPDDAASTAPRATAPARPDVTTTPTPPAPTPSPAPTPAEPSPDASPSATPSPLVQAPTPRSTPAPTQAPVPPQAPTDKPSATATAQDDGHDDGHDDEQPDTVPQRAAATSDPSSALEAEGHDGDHAHSDLAAVTEGDLVAASAPLPAGDAIMLGATWAGDQQLEVRAMRGDGWSDWIRLVRDTSEHMPDPGTAEYERSDIDLSEPVWIGHADKVQFRGTDATSVEVVFIDESDAVDTAQAEGDPAAGAPLAMTAAANSPNIRSRAAWGADESIRRTDSPSYSSSGTVRFSVVHHMGSSLRWTDAQIAGGCLEAAARIRSIYRYHVNGNGWDDIGYNFIVDPCGRIWEGRAGGTTRPVMGAHAGGWNDGSFGVLALGTFSGSNPDPVTSAMRSGIERVIGWKLGLDRVNPGGEVTEVSGGGTSRYSRGTVVDVPVLSAHQITNSTTCPGPALMSVLFNGSASEANPHPTYVNRVRSRLSDPVINQVPWDYDGEGRIGRIVHNPATQRFSVYRGTQYGGLGVHVDTRTFKGDWDVVATGDWNGDGLEGIALLDRSAGELRVYAGNGQGGLGARLSTTHLRYQWDDVVAGDWDGDGDDSIALFSRARHRWQVYEGTDRGALGRRLWVRTFTYDWDQVIAGDWNGDGVDGVALHNHATHAWRLYNGNDRGRMGRRLEAGNLLRAWDHIHAADWNRDGIDSLGYYRYRDGRLHVYSSSGHLMLQINR